MSENTHTGKKLDDKKPPSLKKKFGVVAMIDALGVRNATIEESTQFIGN